MEHVIEGALQIYFKEKIGSDKKSKYLNFVSDDGAVGISGNTSDYLSGKISYEKDGKTQLSQGLFLKLMKDNESSTLGKLAMPKGILTAHVVNELLFYSVIRPFFDLFKKMDDLLPMYNGTYFGATTENNTAVMIFDNLKNSEFVNCTDSFLDYNHLSVLMRKIGQYHAYSMVAKKKQTQRFYVMTGFITDIVNLDPSYAAAWLQKRFATALQPLRSDPSYTSALNAIDGMVKNFPDLNKQQVAIDKYDQMAVLAHRACRSENVLFRYKDGKPVDLKMLDWQTCIVTSLGLDLVLVLYLEASQQMRDEKWDNLIDEYYIGLSQTFPDIEVPSKEAIKQEIKKRLPSVLVVLPQKYYKGPQVLQNDPVTEIMKDVIKRFF